MDVYYTIERNGTTEFKDRGSKFIAYAFPIETLDNFKSALELLKKEHAKATHHCFAYRIGTHGNLFRVSDAGEPSGTAGRPILGQIDSRSLTNILVVVVRYFGGTLLGVPGLINAYKNAASMVLQITPIVQKQVEVLYTLQFDYTIMNEIMNILKQAGASLFDKEMGLFCKFRVGIPSQRMEEVLYRIKELRSVEITKIG